MVDAKTARLDLRTCMKMYDKERIEIMRKIAQEKLGKYYDALKRFYAGVLFETQYQYIVFVARRSIDLAELFSIILWYENEFLDREILAENWSKFTTDSAILALSDEIAGELLRRHYPQILVVDDILVQGNGLNELMRGIEYHVGESVKRKINDDEFIQFRNEFHAGEAFINSLKDELIQALEIRVFAQNAQMSVLALRYLLRLVSDGIMCPAEWHELSCRITNTISATGIANAAFITGAEIPFYTVKNGDPNGNVKPFDIKSICRCIEDEYAIMLECSDDLPVNGKHWKGKDVESYYLIYERKVKNETKYICSLRFIINRYTATCKVLPFVFLPQLTEHSTHSLKKAIANKWGFSFNDNNFLGRNIGSSRMEYELLLLYLSESLLACWTTTLTKGKYIPGLIYDELKSAINYTVNRGNFVVSADAFRKLQDSRYLFNWDELEDILNDITLDAEPICFNYSSMPHPSADYIRQLQDIVYRIKTQELIESYRSFNNLPELESAPIGLSLRENRKHNWNITLSTFVQNCISGINNVSCKDIICELLSYMDKGIVTLKVRKQDGIFAQVLRMGEQSFVLWPERYNKYIPVMIQIQERAERLGGSIKEYLLEFLTHAQQIKIVDPTENLVKLTDDLMLFLGSLRKSGQRLEDWNISFDNPVVLEEEDTWVDRVGNCYVFDRYEAFDKNEKKIKLFNACLDYWP